MNVNCFGMSTGSASVIAIGGTAPYAYSWNTPSAQLSATATNLGDGAWICTITDAHGCSTSQVANITQPAAALALNGSTTPASCGGASNGAVDAMIAGGTAPYTIAWSGPGGFTSNSVDITLLTSGVYMLAVTDANGCTASQTFNVNQPGLFSISGTTTDFNGFEVSCSNATDGEINQTISGGTAPYSHAWTGPNGYAATTEDINGLVIGTYTYSITDANGCSTAVTYDLGAPPILTVMLTPSLANGGWNIGCNGSSTGAIDAMIGGGLAPVSTQWSGPNGFNSGAEDITGLESGNYTLTLADANGCVLNAGQTLIAAAALAGSTTVLANVSCHGGTNGQASVNASGGTAPYSYAWNTTPAQFGPVANGLTAGSYECVITDANGCTTTVIAQITEPASPLAVDVTGFTNVLCHNTAQGTAQALASGGSAPYTYSWSSAPAQLTANATDLPAGSYTVTATDAQGCTAANGVTIGGPQFGIDGYFEQVSHVTCFGEQDGSATINVSGGSNSFTITWNTIPPRSGPTVTNLAPGNYLVHVIDNNGCDHEKFYPITILGPASPMVVQISVNTITCTNASDGSIDLTMSGGMGPYTHYWYDIDGDFTSQQDLNGLDPDTYTLQAHDALGCAYDTAIVMVDPPLLLVSAVTSPAECSGAASGAIDVTASGGTGAYTYAWFGPNNFFSTAEDLAAISAGNYHLVVTDANGCTRFNDPVVTQPGNLQITFSASSYNGPNTSCAGASDGSIDLTITGGSGSYSASWSGPNGFTSTTEDIGGLVAGSYQVTVTDGNGCSLQGSIALAAPTLAQATLTLSDNNGYGVSCNGATDGSISLDLAGGTAPFTSVWSGPNGFTSTDADITGLAVGTYDLFVTDANGCITNASANILAPTALGSNLQVMLYPGGTQISCAAVNDGAIDLSITGGVAPYAISWTNGLGFSSTDEDISALEAGGYQATITDANGCSTTAFATLIAPEPIGLSAQLSGMNGSNVSCDGATDGSIDLTMSGGTAPYAFIWDNGSTDEDLTGIGAGTYAVTAVDANGCAMNASYTLVAPATFDIDLLGTAFPGGANISCNGASDGTVEAIINGGTAPYVLAWSGPNGFTASVNDLTSISAGDYELVVTDANGCSGNASINIAQPEPVVVQIASTTFNGNYNIPCAGLSIGQAVASATGGTAGYSYLWNGPNGFNSVDPSIVGQIAGDFIVIATDSNGCTGSASITLLEPEVLEVTIDIADLGGYPVSCTGNDGSASVVIDGGTPQFFISWTGPDGFTSTYPSVNGLNAGDYDLTVTDANGCQVQETFTLTQPDALSASFAYTTNACATDLDGAIDLAFTGGAAPYSFAWTGPNGFAATTEDIASLATGPYAVQVTDALGCNATFNAVLDGPAPINSGTYVSFYGLYNLQCLGDSSGAINLTPTGGITPFSVAISGPGGFASTALVNDSLVAGEYLITITDQNGCTLDTTVTLTQPDTQVDAALTASVYPSGTNVSCFGASDGSIDATVTGGNGPYTFDWRGPDSLAFATEDINGLPAGQYEYELVVIDANQCAFTTTITLTQPDSALAATVLVSDYNGYGVSCPSSTDGTISVGISGGNGGYGVVWNGPNGFSSTGNDLSNLIAGTYTATMTDMNGCTLVQDVVVSAPPVIEIALSAFAYASGSNISCAGAADGSITATVIGGVGSPTLAWSGPNGSITGGSTISDLAEGAYCLSVTDANGCTNQACFTLSAPDVLEATTTPTDAACGQQTGSIDLLVNGGSAPYSYAWDNGSATQDINGLAAGTYSVSVTDMNGCTTTSSASIATTPAVEASAQVVDVLCNGSNSGGIDLSVATGTAPYAFVWSNASTSEDLTAIGGGAYSVIVTDANGCNWNGAWTVNESEAITIDSTLSSYVSGDNVSAFGASDGSITIVPQGGSAPYAVLWSNGANTNQINGLSAGTYTVTITDANGCTLMSTFILTEPQDLELPTGYTPNGDGYNDVFIVHGLDAYPANTFTVLNRWGNVVYDRLNFKNDWAGENSQGDMLPSGTYFVILNINNGERVLQSYVDLRR
jgi:large repetitive protein